MPNKRGYKKRGSALKTSPPATSPRRTKTPAPTQTLTPVRRVGRPPSKLRSPASPVQRSSLPTVSPKPGEKLQQSCNHTQQSWSNVNCGTAAAEATKPRQMHDSPEHSTSLQDSSDQEINIQDHIYRPQSQHSVSEDDAIHANPTPTAAMPPDSHPQEDANNSQNRPKKLSKREVKALLKQPKRARTILDESVVAEMDQLATRFEVDCKINVAGVIRRPIPVAEPIDSNTSPLSAPSVPVSPPAPSVVRGGRGRGRGRRGSAAAASLRRGGGKAGSFASLTPAPTRTPRTASWSPLCLPARASYEAPLHKSPAPRLKFLSASCVKNFLAKAESILSRSHSQQSRLLPTHSLDANGFDFSHKQEPAPLTTYPSLPPTAPAAEQSYYQHQQQKPAYHHHHHHHHHHNEMPEEQHPMRKAEAYPSNYAPHSPPPPQPPPSTAPVVPGPPDSLQVGETSSAVSIVRHVRIGRPPKRGGQRRGRGRPRILNLPSDDALRAAVAEAGAESERAKWHQYEGVDQPRSYHPAGDSGDLRGASPQKPPSPATEAIPTGGASGAPDCLTMQHLAKPGKPGRPRGSIGARRELRGLVTWAAMMAAEEQAAQQKQHRRHSSREEEDADSSFNAEPTRKPTGLSPLSLQIVGMEDDLTATAADGSGLSDPSRTTRRTRRASLGTASGGSSVGATRGGHVSGRRASETGSSVSVVDAGDQSLKDGLQRNASSWTSDQADTSSLLPFSPSPLHVAASDATMDSTGPERQQNNSASNGEVGLPTNASEEDQVQPPVRPLHRGRGGGGVGRGRKRKYQRGIGRPSEQNIPPSPSPPPTPSQSDLSMPTAFPPFAAGNGASSDDNNGDKCVSGSPLKSTAADDEDSSSSGARRLDPAASGGGSGGPILPPRKRYKANVDSADEQRPSTSPQPTSRSPLSPSMDGGDLSSPSPPSNPAHPNLSDLCGGYLAPVGSAGVRSSLESDSSPFGVRGGTRGRGGLRGRRKGRGGRRSLHQPFETHQDAKAAADNAATSVVDTTPSRPKREAAALGFASLVASSLNSSPIQYDQSESSIKPSQQTPVDHHHQNSPSLTTPETVDPATTPTTPVGTTLASVRTPSQKSWRGGGTPPVGRGRGLRGRPPKRPIAATPTVLFPPPLLAATASAAATGAADGTLQAKMDSSFSSETSATTATSINDSPSAQSATTPTAAAAAAAVTDAPVSAPSEAELSGAGLLPAPPVSTEASVVTGEGLPVLTGKRKIGGGGKRGRRPTAATQVSSPPTKRRAVEDTAPLPPSSVNGSSATAPTTKTPPPPPASSASGFGTDELNHACRDLRLFLLRTHARSEHRLRRDRERRSKATANVDDTVGSTKRLLTGTVERLPSRNLIFPFGSLARKLLDESEEKAGLNADLVPTGGVQALLATLLDRLLNHPDLEPNGTGARLVAPLLSTPDPLRHPDFYRYACSTGALASLETALGLPRGTGHSLQADILLTVSPCYCFTNGYAGQRSVPAPFQHLSPEFPPICLRSLLHSVLNGKLLLTSDAESSPSATTATAFQRLDLAFDLLMRLWEAYAGRRSWLGRRLLQIRGAYTRLRTEQTAEDSSIPLPHLTPGSASAANKIQGASPGGGPLKKKVDRRTLERGAEVIRCLCGFRVEAGHVMVQCDCCTTWQHLPCVWWALSICLEPSLAAPRSTPASQLANWLPHQPPHDPGFEPEEGAAADSAGRRARCRAALLAALQTGGISLPAHSGGGNCGSAGSTTAPDCAYFCPTCLELDGLTKDYPRTLAVALAQNDVAKVFPETAPESTAGVTYEYWSLASPDGGDQLLTDEFALVHRDDFQHAVERGSIVAATAAGTTAETGEETNELRLASDVVVLRIYRLWKDSSGKSWMEGGAFLRPYDLLKGAPPQTTALVNSQLWHARELVYDEASRVVLPLSAWRGRCSVLSPTVYRQGRLMDLPALILPSSTAEVEETDAHPLVFLCDRLFNRGEGDSLSFQEIAPAYLKVNMKPYAFLRHTESSALRAAIVRQLRAEDLRTLDSSTAFGAVLSVNLDGLYSQSRERRQKGRPLSPRRTHELVFSLSEKITLDAALGRLSSQSRKQHATTTDSQLFTHTNRKSCLPAKLGDSTIGHPNLPTGASEALSLSAGPTPELSSTSALLLTEGTEPTTPATIHATADSAVIPSTKRSGKSKAGSGKIRDQDLLKDAKTLTFSELREKIAAQEGLSAKTPAPSPRRKVLGKQHTVSAVKSSLKHTSAAAAAAAPTDSTPQPDLGPPKSPLFVETTTPTVTDLTKKPQFSPISPATSPLSPDPTSSAIAIITDTLQQQQQQQRLPENHNSPPPSSQASEDLHPTAPSTVIESTFPGVPRLLSSSEQIEPDKPTEETVSELSDVELSSKAATGSTVIATATETACHNTASSEVMLATPSRLKPIPLKVNQALVMVSSNEEENFETCDELFPIPEPQLVAIQEEENDDFAEDGDVQSSCVHLSAGVTLSTTESVSLVTCAPAISHRAEASRIPCGVKTLESSPQLEMLEGLDATEVNEEFAQWTVCSPAGADSHLNPFSTVCEMVLNSPFSTTAVAPMSLSGVPSPAEATSTVVSSLSDFITESADAIVYTCPLASLVAPACRVSPPNGQQNQPLRPLISPALTYQPISPDSSDESPRRTHASVQPPPQSEIPNAVGDDSVQSDGNRLSTTAATDEEKRQRHSVSRSSPSGVWSPAQSRDHRDRRRHSHHRYHHHHHRDRDHHRRSSSNRSRSNSEHQQPSEHHHQHRHYHHRQHRHSDCSSVDSEQRERQRSRSQSDHRHSRHERYPEAKDATASVAAAENTSRPNSHHRRRKGHSPKRIVFRRYEDGTSATATRDSAVTAPVPQEGVLDLSTSSSSTLAPESNGGEVSSGGSSNN